VIILLGLFLFFREHGNFGGLWLAFIGWFLLDAARTSYAQAGLISELRGRRVADIMDRSRPTVEAHLSLQDFVDAFLLHKGLRGYVVVQNEQIVGLLTPHEVKQISRDLWPQTSVQVPGALGLRVRAIRICLPSERCVFWASPAWSCMMPWCPRRS